MALIEIQAELTTVGVAAGSKTALAPVAFPETPLPGVPYQLQQERAGQDPFSEPGEGCRCSRPRHTRVPGEQPRTSDREAGRPGTLRKQSFISLSTLLCVPADVHLQLVVR